MNTTKQDSASPQDLRNEARRLRTRVSTREYATDMARADQLDARADQLEQSPQDAPCWHGATVSTCQHDTHNGEQTRPTTVKPAGPFGGNSQSGRTAQHGTQSGYVMHRRHGQAACQPCKDAHAAYGRELLLSTVHGECLDGCTCQAIRGAHSASCQWHM